MARKPNYTGSRVTVSVAYAYPSPRSRSGRETKGLPPTKPVSLTRRVQHQSCLSNKYANPLFCVGCHIKSVPWPVLTKKSYAGTTTMTDRRKAARESALKVGMIEFHPVGEARCMIRNISPTGALLEIGSPVALPNQFVLAVLSNHTRRHCKVVWRHRNRLGVVFQGPEYSSPRNPVARSLKPRRTDTSRSIEMLVRAAIANSVAR
jgi:hypothetical protein